MKLHEINIRISDESQMRRFGKHLAAVLSAGDIVCLTGDLGAGKTTLTKSIAEGLEVDDYVTSPSYTIVNEYEGRLKLYHFDVYRINDIEEMYELGHEEYFYGDGVCVIEWAGMIEELLPENRIWIEIYRGDGLDARNLVIKATPELIKTLEEVL